MPNQGAHLRVVAEGAPMDGKVTTDQVGRIWFRARRFYTVGAAIPLQRLQASDQEANGHGRFLAPGFWTARSNDEEDFLAVVVATQFGDGVCISIRFSVQGADSRPDNYRVVLTAWNFL